MPKARVEKEVANDGKWATIEREVKERENVKLAQYHKPLTFDALASFIMDASASPGLSYKKLFPLTDRADEPTESEQSFILRLFQTALDKWASADVYESLASESTIITVGKEKLDLMTIPLKNLIKGYNGTVAQVETRTMLAGGTDDAREAAERSVGFGPWKVVARKLSEGYIDKDGKMVQAQAKYDEASGSLVAI